MIVKVDAQFTGFALGAIVPFGTALLVTPLIARSLSDQGLLLAGAALVAHALFGLFDIFRPILIRRFVTVEGPVALGLLLVRPLIVAIPLALLVTLAIGHFLPNLGVQFAISAGLSLLVFLMGTPFWARLDAAARTGLAFVLRASGIFTLYILLSATPVLLSEAALPWFLLVSNVVASVALALAARGYFARVGVSIVMPAKEMAYVFGQNLLKSFGDYADRIAIVGMGNAGIGGQYNLLADLPIKANVPAQIAATYSYPKLCVDDAWLNRFVVVGTVYSSLVITAALLLYGFGRPLYILYYGDRFAALFPLFCLLFTAAGTYTLSFFGQAFLRSRAHDGQLLVSFGLPALIGALILIFGPLDLTGILSALIAFRSCSFLMAIFSIRAGGRLFWLFLPVYAYALAASLFLLNEIRL